ncbi:ABC transporter ATP-binding protein [Streptomyces actinomycinicus]|uniref:ABC transporter ATP-binding protein n=2 Tax=Streptomyces actinomycinicus TaxID=1695166 RepID=A0A937EPP8_9ACTN|nr:ABC transporter ATP-binding protein [Streptomyces actinomycinicus]MBL1085774.1 ABC transporter ATP-binding protein [Streptomyces actinomycinicus]
MIEAVGLTKRYGDKTAVYNLSFQVRPGAVTGFLGPNGSGKSTTMRMILGLDNPTSGSVTIGGYPYRKLPNAPRQVGALLDAKAVHGGRAARNHLLSLAQLSGIPARRVDEVLGVVGLQDVARKRSKGFSLGMGQRLGIAAALLGDPQVLLFDEPVNGLDPEGILWVRNLMKALAAEGRTVFVSSHLMSEMALTADHLIVIGRGQLLADMSIKDFISANSADFARVRTPDTEPQLREKLSSALTEAGGHVLPEQDGALRITGLALPRISDLAHEAGVRLWELSPHQASLEEAYMRMTQGAVDYRSTVDQRAGLQQPLPPGVQPPVPVPGQGQPGWYAPPPPQQGGQPFAMPAPAAGPYGAAPAGGHAAPAPGTANPYAHPGAPAQPAAQPHPGAPAQPAAPAPQAQQPAQAPAAGQAPQDQPPALVKTAPAAPAAPATAPAAPAAPAPAAPAAPAPAAAPAARPAQQQAPAAAPPAPAEPAPASAASSPASDDPTQPEDAR